MLSKIILPPSYNYIGVFLTMKCNMRCSYCLNKHGDFQYPEEMSVEAWTEGLSRLSTRADLPLTIQGGEPTIYPGFYTLMKELYSQNIFMDLLTNGLFSYEEFISRVPSDMFERNAKYASIRFSFHDSTHLMGLAFKVWQMQIQEYDVGMWGLTYPHKKTIERNEEMKEFCHWLGIDFRLKEYLGPHKGKTLGTYKYPDAVGQLATKKVWCKGSELLVNPSGYIFKCHADLYANRNNIGHILDQDFKIKEKYIPCEYYGQCNPCDVKLKTNRFQEGGHCSVEVKGKEVMENSEILGCPYCHSADYEYDETEDIYECYVCGAQYEELEDVGGGE